MVTRTEDGWLVIIKNETHTGGSYCVRSLKDEGSNHIVYVGTMNECKEYSRLRYEQSLKG